MAETILLDGAPFHFPDHSFPMLIHGIEGSGASFFSLALLADLYKKGKNIIMLSGFSHARDNFFAMTHARAQSVLIEDDNSIHKAEHKRIIVIKREKAQYLAPLLTTLHDSKQRIILIKNLELFGDSVLTPLLQHSHVIYSGNIDESPLKFKLLSRHYPTKIYFSPLHASDVVLPLLPQYGGYMVGNSTGLIAIKKEN